MSLVTWRCQHCSQELSWDSSWSRPSRCPHCLLDPFGSGVVHRVSGSNSRATLGELARGLVLLALVGACVELDTYLDLAWPWYIIPVIGIYGMIFRD